MVSTPSELELSELIQDGQLNPILRESMLLESAASKPLAENQMETYVVMTEKDPSNPYTSDALLGPYRTTPFSDYMTAFSDYLSAYLDDKLGRGKSVVLIAPNYEAAVRIASEHGPSSVAYIGNTFQGHDGERVQAFLRETSMGTSGVFNPLSSMPDVIDNIEFTGEDIPLEDLTRESFPKIAENFFSFRAEVMNGRKDFYKASKASLDAKVSRMGRSFTEEIFKLEDSPDFTKTIGTKIGGSTFDKLTEPGGLDVLTNLAEVSGMIIPNYNTVYTMGMGPIGDMLWNMGEGVGQQLHTREGNIRDLAGFFKNLLGPHYERLGPDYDIKIVDETNAGEILPYLKDYSLQGKRWPHDIILIASPEGLISEEAIHPKDSDLLFVEIAHYLRVHNPFVVKNTPGIFGRDPHLTKEAAWEKLDAQHHHYIENNPSIDRIYFNDILAGKISRIGVEQGDENEHLMSTNALRKGQLYPDLSSIRVYDCMKPWLYIMAAMGIPKAVMMNDMMYTHK